MHGKMQLAVFTAGILLIPAVVSAAGTWVTKAPPPIGGFFNPSSAPVLNGKIYLVGGSDGNGDDLVPTQIYDSAADSWTTDTSVGFVSGGLAAEINGTIYYAGGCSFSDCNSPTNALRIFDPLTHVWTNGAPMPTARGNVAGGVLNGELYVTTGATNSSGTVAVNMLEIYDPVANQWSAGAPMPLATPRRNAMAATLGGKLFIIGGSSPTGPEYDRVDVYDPFTDSWTQEQPLPQPVYSAAAAVLNGRIHIFGGLDAGGNTLNTHYVFDPSTHAWSAEAPLPTSRAALAGAAAGTAIYAIGGAQTGFVFTPVNEAFSESPPTPTDKDQCKDGGWENFDLFKNQGDCIQYVNTGK